MVMPAVQERRWTAREVRELIAAQELYTPRYELVDGELLVTPSPARAHQEAVALLLIALTAYLEREPVGHALHSPADVELEPEDVRQPDLFVVPRDEWRRLVRDEFPARTLLVAIEVVSPSSGRYDRVVKRRGYQRHVSEYWIVDTDARLVERWRPGDERPEILTESLEWRPEGAAGVFTLELRSFFARVFSD
jgi:Uma2 family endonuclease